MRRGPSPGRPPDAPGVDDSRRRTSTKGPAQSAWTGCKPTGATSSTTSAGRRTSKSAERKSLLGDKVSSQQYHETIGKPPLSPQDTVLFRRRQSERGSSLPPYAAIIDKDRVAERESLDGSWTMDSTLTTDPNITVTDSSSRCRKDPSKDSSSRLSSLSSQGSKDSYTRPPRLLKKDRLFSLLSQDSLGTKFHSPSNPSACAADATVRPQIPTDPQIRLHL